MCFYDVPTVSISSGVPEEPGAARRPLAPPKLRSIPPAVMRPAVQRKNKVEKKKEPKTKTKTKKVCP